MFNTLQELLERMGGCATGLEDIILQEQEAVRHFDGDALMELMDRRVEAYSQLAELEDKCKALLISSDASKNMTLEALIDLYAGTDQSRFQSLRRELYERMLRIERGNSENRIRLHAAYDVTTNVLLNVGALEKRQTYGPQELK
ncbi:MAG: flagellar export chaperone FlgN [Mariprofundaceae bacterium]